MRPKHLNIDSTEDQRLRRIRCIAQGFILRKFKDPKVNLEEKQKLAEKIYLANIKVAATAEEITGPQESPFDKDIMKEQMAFLNGIKV